VEVVFLKKVSILLAGLLFVFASVAFAAQNAIKIVVNDAEIKTEVPPQIINGRTMLPLRDVAKALGAAVKWDPNNRVVYITGKGLPVKPAVTKLYKLGETAKVNDLSVTINSVEYIDILNKPHIKTELTIDNPSKQTYKSLGHLEFEIDQAQYQNEINTQGYYNSRTISWIYPEESFTFYFAHINSNNLKVKSVTYVTHDGTVVGTWKVQ